MKKLRHDRNDLEASLRNNPAAKGPDTLAATHDRQVTRYRPGRSTSWGLCAAILLQLLTTPMFAADEPPRAARSVHLGYSAPEGDLFYNEMIIDESVNGSYFMACGWNTGYFGLQQLRNPTNKVVIFSVWDPTRGDNPNAVKEEDRVEVLYSGDGVRIRRFGGEGTGGQCMAPFPWQIGQTNHFVIQALVQSNKTAYTAWIFDHRTNDWWKLATFRTRTGGRPLRGYYSFVEDFRRDRKSADEVRRARFGNGWVRDTKGQWLTLTNARFTASNASWEAKDNIDAGTKGEWFYLATGGQTERSRELRSTIALPRHSAAPVLPFLRE